MTDKPMPLTVPLEDGSAVSALLDVPDTPVACYVFAHGAGAGMHHSFMAEVAQGLARRGVAVLRFQFPYMEKGSKRPDVPKVAQAAIRAAVALAARRFADLPLFAGGKSYGGRMGSQAQAAQPLAGVRGLAFVGFPLHPAGKPSTDRAAHLADVQLPMLFLQGTRDSLAELALIQQTTAALGERTTLHVVDGADHSFHLLAKSGRTDTQAREELVDVMHDWMIRIAA